MPKVIILGSSNAVPSKNNENTHMVVVGEERMLLIDAVSNPIVRLEDAGLDFVNDLTDIVITHFHPDHVSGLPLLLMDMWIMGRQKPINIYGLHYTLDRVVTMMDLYNWTDWPNFYPVSFYRIPSKELTEVMSCPDFKVHASPVHHMIPNIGLRIEFSESQQVMAYSCDTEMCDEVVRLSEGADVLIHEAAGEAWGHSSPKQAGEVAQKAEVGKLYLIHYSTGKYAKDGLLDEAKTTFTGDVELATDFLTLDFSEKSPLAETRERIKFADVKTSGYQPEI